MRISSATRNGFTFVLGGVVGAFVVAGALGEGDEELPTLGPPPPPPIGQPNTFETHSQLQRVELDASASDAELAAHLEHALFERTWAPVGPVARALRERALRKPATLASPVRQPGEPSLFALHAAYQRRTFWEGLAQRDNPATRTESLSHTEQRRRLVDLFLAPITRPADRETRRDAALLLGRLGVDAGREALFEALEGADPERADLAQLALGNSGDAKAVAGLLTRLEGDSDPALRARAARALAGAPEVQAGGQAAARLAATLTQERVLDVRLAVIEALARADLHASAPARDALARVLGDAAEAPLVRMAAVATLDAYHRAAQTLPEPLVVAAEQALSGALGDLKTSIAALLGVAGRRESLAALEAEPQTAATAEAIARLRARWIDE